MMAGDFSIAIATRLSELVNLVDIVGFMTTINDAKKLATLAPDHQPARQASAPVEKDFRNLQDGSMAFGVTLKYAWITAPA